MLRFPLTCVKEKEITLVKYSGNRLRKQEEVTVTCLCQQKWQLVFEKIVAKLKIDKNYSIPWARHTHLQLPWT